MPRKILHIDLDAFFCSVEENNDPTLKGKPFAVGGRPDQRGVVASCSYAARKFGVHSAMPMGQALRVCPNLIVVSGRHSDYGKISHQIMDYLRTLTPLIQPVSIDEAFLDLSDLPDTGEQLAISIQTYIREHFNLPCSIGVATNKLVAKIATDFGKASKRSITAPQAIMVVEPGREAEFLSPLPTKALWGIGPKTAAHLEELGIHTIGDITRLSKPDLHKYLGNFGDDLEKRAHGIDDSQVHEDHEIKSVSNETTFAHDISDIKELYETLHWLSESVGRRLRKKKLKGSTVKLKIRWSDFTTLSRQSTVPNPTSDDLEIYVTAKDLFNKTWKKGKPVRLLGVGVTQFSNPVRQLGLWDSPVKKDSKLFSAVDVVHERFGKDSLIRGSELKYVKREMPDEDSD